MPAPELVPPHNPPRIQFYYIYDPQLDVLQSRIDILHDKERTIGANSNIIWGAGGILASSLATFLSFFYSYESHPLFLNFFLFLSIVMATTIGLKAREMYGMKQQILEIKTNVSTEFDKIRKQAQPQ